MCVWREDKRGCVRQKGGGPWNRRDQRGQGRDGGRGGEKDTHRTRRHHEIHRHHHRHKSRRTCLLALLVCFCVVVWRGRAGEGVRTTSLDDEPMGWERGRAGDHNHSPPATPPAQ